MSPEAAMRQALAAARRASGRTWPNPPVGAVVFRGDRVLGRGATRTPPGPHAEVVALAAARRRHGAAALRGASLAVTLEPCDHVGRTGPCTRAILEAGIARVYAGHRDPAPHGRGRGLRRLRAAGVAVEVGVLEEACRHQHRGFVSVQSRGRPWVALKLAATLDGRIATRSGESRWITGPRARAYVHRLRAAHDAVAVGAGTARADDPALTARRAPRAPRAGWVEGVHGVHGSGGVPGGEGGDPNDRIVRRPARVVFDTRLRVPARARLFADDAPVFAVCGREAPAHRRRALERREVRVLAVRSAGGRVHLPTALRRLAREGLTALLVEGGGELAAALLRADLVDELHWIAAPRLLGADGIPALGALGVGRLARAVALEAPQVRRLGDDVVVEGRVRRAGAGSAGAADRARARPGAARRRARAGGGP